MLASYTIDVTPAVRFTLDHLIMKDAKWYFLCSIEEILEYFGSAYLRGGYLSDSELVDDNGETYFKEELWEETCDYWINFIGSILDAEVEDIDRLGFSWVSKVICFSDLSDYDNPVFKTAHMELTI